MSRTDWRFWSGLFAALIFLNYPAAASPCDHAEDPAAITDCTQSINSGKWKGRYLAVYYGYRAGAYHKRGDNDHAIADYDAVIRLEPDAFTYSNRSLAYRDKGEIGRASCRERVCT